MNRSGERKTALLFGGAIVALSYLFRLPALLNAEATNSDAAVVGLQAMHILRGDFVVHLWGSGYQTSVDSYVAAAFFAVLGPNALALMLSALTLHTLLTLGVFVAALRIVSPARALAVVLPLIFTASVVHSYALYPPRQAALTLAMLAFVVLESSLRRRAFFSALLAVVAAFADPYALLFLPIFALHALLVLQDTDRPERRGVFVALVAGSTFGALPLAWLWFHPLTAHQQSGLEISRVSKNFELLLDPCLPWVLGTRNYVAKQMMDYEPWAAPRWVFWLSFFGALALLFGLVLSALSMRRWLPRSASRLGVVGVSMMGLTLIAFLFSVMVMDHFSMRYLVGFVLGIPFALLPAWATPVTDPSAGKVFQGLRRRGALVAAVLFSASAAVGGWAGFGPFVDGLRPRLVPSAANTALLRETLAREGIDEAIADYWAAYRLSFLFREHPIVVPTNPDQDRNAAQRARVLSAPRYAFIVDRERSYDAVEIVEPRLRKEGKLEARFDVGTVTAFIVRRENSP